MTTEKKDTGTKTDATSVLTLEETIKALEHDKQDRLHEIETAIRTGLAKGSKLTLCLLIHEAKTLLVPDEVQGKHSPRSKRIWGGWFRDALKAEGISAATGFRYADAGEVLSAKYNSAFLAALTETGIALTISPSKDRPIGQFTELVDQADENSELRDALKQTNATKSAANWVHFAATTLPTFLNRFRAAKAGAKPKTPQARLELAEHKLYESIIASIPKLIRITGNDCNVTQVKATVHDLIEKLLWAGGYEPGSTQEFSVPTDSTLTKILTDEEVLEDSAPSAPKRQAKSASA